MMRKVVYTAIIGDYDTLKDPLVVTAGWEYLCFTDQPLKSDVWKIIPVEPEEDKIRQARKIKIIPPFEYDECLWMDASFLIKGNVDEFIKKFKTNFGLLKHPHRNNILEEAKTIIDINKDDAEIVDRQMIEYFNTPFKYHSYTLPASGIIFRRWDVGVGMLSSYWIKQVMSHSRRDQLSFNYSAFALGSGVPHEIIPDNIYDKNHPFFLLQRHK